MIRGFFCGKMLACPSCINCWTLWPCASRKFCGNDISKTKIPFGLRVRSRKPNGILRSWCLPKRRNCAKYGPKDSDDEHGPSGDVGDPPKFCPRLLHHDTSFDRLIWFIVYLFLKLAANHFVMLFLFGNIRYDK